MQLVQTTQSANTPVIVATAGTAITSNPARISWSIQNLGTNALFVLLGTGASTTVFHFVLKAGSGSDDGTAGAVSQEAGVIYTGDISVAGTSPRFTYLEQTP